MYAKDGFTSWMGIVRVAEGEGYCKLQMSVRPEMLNGFGIAHGGITYTLADSCFAFASNSHGRKSVSIETAISHCGAVQVGDVLTAEATEENLGQKIAIYSIIVTNQNGKKVAIFRGTVYRTSEEWQIDVPTSNLVFATNNAHKIREIKEIFAGKYMNIRSLAEINCLEDLPETQNTIVGNALQKARYVAENYKIDCFAEDTGLEVDALDGEPGVFSARYAGTHGDSVANMALVIEKLGKNENRRARFRTVIALILNNQEFTFEGVCEGSIRINASGEKGFGYDPIFQPDGFDVTFAEMDSETKNKISHRGKATAKFIDFLKANFG